MADLTGYKQQFDALMHVLSLFEARYGNEEDTPWQGQPKIKALLKELRLFAQGQFLFFYNGFSDTPPPGFPKLNKHASSGDNKILYPPEHVLATTILQISADLAVIQTVAEQRLLHYNQFDENLKRTADILGGKGDIFSDLDNFARASLWHADTIRDESENKTVIAYMADYPNVRVMPYAKVIFVGFSSTVTQYSRALFSVPHEVGHFRFWNSSPQDSDITTLGQEWSKLQTRSLNVREMFFPFQSGPTAWNWGEEIFADVYGALVGGVPFITSAMEMALEHSTKIFLDFDFTDPHPTPLIRPLLMIKALKELSNATGGKALLNVSNIQATATTLLKTWEDKLLEHEIDDYRDRVDHQVTWDSQSLDKSLPIEEVVCKAIDALRYVFRKSDPPAPWGWSIDINDAVAKATEYFVQLDEFLKMANERRILLTRPHPHMPPWLLNLHPSISPETEPISNEVIPEDWKQWALDKGYFEWDPAPAGTITLPTDEMWAGVFETVMKPPTRPSKTWLPIFGAGGWTTEGPCTFPPG